ncbi:aspartyl protease family protein [Arundinibacter roseus]|uniref:PDZ domain-containing protein n=1 Tax=Arundinibacter roseus TaxID=2070510 RepID=A0A4R4K1G4_9BACT|nr:aspartyl protease family protein [Arundinibacter roseus]TDB61134.1 hypothetical protein EZE20_19910 [Arundinibacter roseus]
MQKSHGTLTCQKPKVLYLIALSIFLIASCKTEQSLVSKIISKHYYKEWFFLNTSGDETTTIPFEIIDGWIVLKLQINEKDTTHYKFIFDTGAMTTIDLDLARNLNLPILRDLTAVDVNSSESKAVLTSINKLKIGERTFFNVGAISSKSDIFGCNEIKGLFGLNLMRDAVFRINFKSKLLSISSTLNASISNFDQIKIANDWKKYNFIELKSNNKTINALFDTGFPDYVALNNSLKNKFEIDSFLKSKLLFTGGLSSSVSDTLHFYRPHNLKAGEQMLDREVFVFSNNKTLIGSGFLSGFEEVIIDVSNNKLYVSKNKTEISKLYKIPNVTLGWKNGSVKVTSLVVGSKVEEMGIRLDDQVVSINNISTSDLHDACMYKKFKIDNAIFKSDLRLTILRSESMFDYFINSSILYD